MCSLGLVDPTSQTFEHWNGSIMGQHGNFENRFLKLKLFCGEDYPNEPPEVTFVHKVSLPNVDEQGKVDVTAVLGGEWNPCSHGMKEILESLRNSMQTNRGIVQPEENSEY